MIVKLTLKPVSFTDKHSITNAVLHFRGETDLQMVTEFLTFLQFIQEVCDLDLHCLCAIDVSVEPLGQHPL